MERQRLAWHGLAGHGGHGEAGLGPDGRGGERHGRAWQSSQGKVRPGTAGLAIRGMADAVRLGASSNGLDRQGTARPGSLGEVGQVAVRSRWDWAWLGTSGRGSLGTAHYGGAWRGGERRSWLGLAEYRYGEPGRVVARRSWFGKAEHRVVRLGTARIGPERQGSQDMGRLAKVWSGRVWLASARKGLAVVSRHGAARDGEVRSGREWQGSLV